MSDIATKLTYLGETKSILKDTINMSNANITNSTTFRNYAMQLKEGYIDILNNGTDTLYNNFTHLTGKGMTLSFAPTYQAPMKITCYGSTSQASTPTPSSPVEVVNTTGNQSISVYSKNTFDETKLSQEANYNTYNSQTGLWTTNSGIYYYRSILYDAVGSNRDRDITKLIPLKPDTNYTLNLYNFVNNTTTTTGTFINIGFFDNTGTLISNSNKNTTLITFTSPNQECYLDIRRLDSSGTFSFSKVLLVEGTYTSETLPSYEAYNGTNYNIGLGNIELCKIGDYEDKIDKSTGKNLIDNANITYNYSNVSDSYNILTTINTGIRYKTTYNNGSPVVVFKSIDLTNYVGKTIRFKANFGEKGRITLALCNADVSSRTAIQASTTSGNTITYVVPNNLGEQKYLAYYLGIVGATGNDTEDFTNLIITIDNEDMTYEPYGKEWYLKKNIGKVVLDGTENWTGYTDLGINARGYYTKDGIIKKSNGFSNRFNIITTDTWNSDETGIMLTPISASLIGIKLPKTLLSTENITGIKTWLSTHNTTVYYALATPTYTKITDSTLIEQLEAIKSKDNTTNITSSMVIGAIALKKE